jgi:O-succinylbenzoate synthase
MRRPFRTSRGTTHGKDLLLVLVRSGGLTGYGECVAETEPGYLPETTDTVWPALRDFLVPLAFTLDLEHPRELWPALRPVRGHEMAKAALEMAVWDLMARQRDVPLCRLLGGSAREVAAGVSVGLQDDIAALLAAVEAERAAGYRRIKIKIEPGHDHALVRAVRERFAELPLMVDANGAYGADHLPALQALDGFGLTMIEQPFDWDDLVLHARLQQRLDTPVCLDESIRSPHAAWQALELAACRVINIKPGRVGGLAPSLAIHDLCRERGVPVWCGGMLETGIGRLANVHLQTLPGFTLPGDTSAGARLFEEDLVEPGVTVSAEGLIRVPDGPGLGQEIVWPRVERSTRWREELRPA